MRKKNRFGKYLHYLDSVSIIHEKKKKVKNYFAKLKLFSNFSVEILSHCYILVRVGCI